MAEPILLRNLAWATTTAVEVLLLGLIAWTLRYILLAFGNAGPGMWMFYLAILLHGVCFDFFFMTGQMYTDQRAPSHLRSTAQGLYTFLTYGAGMLAGSLLSGFALEPSHKKLLIL